MIDAHFNARYHGNIIFLHNLMFTYKVAVFWIGCVWCRLISEVLLAKYRELGFVIVEQTSFCPSRLPVEVVTQLLAFVFLRFSAHQLGQDI